MNDVVDRKCRTVEAADEVVVLTVSWPRRLLASAAATITLVTLGLVLGAGTAQAAGAPILQGDCGRVTCTIRLNRNATRNVRDGAALGAGAGGTCAAVPGVPIPPPVRAACGVSALPLAAWQVLAGRIYENGNCLGFRYVKRFSPSQPPVLWPISVKGGRYNCR